MLTKHQAVIFETVVNEFTWTAESVGSKKLMDLLDFSYSSVTIRNEIATLGDLGLLGKTHTSSSRIPSSRGYWFCVGDLMERELDDRVKHSLQAVFQKRHYSMDEIVKKNCDILSQVTSLTSVVLGSESRYQALQHVQLFPLSDTSAVAVSIADYGHTEDKISHFNTTASIEDIKTCYNPFNDKLGDTPINEVMEYMQRIEPLLASHIARHKVLFETSVNAFIRFAADRVYCGGQNSMLYQPRFTSIEKLKELMKVLEDSGLFRQLANREGDVAIEIGGDSGLIQVNNITVVSSKFKLNEGEERELMIVRPTRIQYSRVVVLMECMSKAIEDLYRSENR